MSMLFQKLSSYSSIFGFYHSCTIHPPELKPRKKDKVKQTKKLLFTNNTKKTETQQLFFFAISYSKDLLKDNRNRDSIKSFEEKRREMLRNRFSCRNQRSEWWWQRFIRRLKKWKLILFFFFVDGVRWKCFNFSFFVVENSI